MQSYLYNDLNNLIHINTLSPNNNFYYKVQKPISINMTNFACKVAFYNISSVLLYYREDVLAHWLKPWQNIEVVSWSQEGNMAYFYEYNRNKIYESVFLNLKDKYCYRINEEVNNFSFVEKLQLKDRKYDEITVIAKLQELGLNQQPLIKDKIPQSNRISKLLRHNKWYPI